jgi:hypothetical protein
VSVQVIRFLLFQPHQRHLLDRFVKVLHLYLRLHPYQHKEAAVLHRHWKRWQRRRQQQRLP